MDALVESAQPGSAKFRCFHPPPPFVEDCSWELQSCGSFVTSKTMFDAVHTLATQPYECCSISEQILGMQRDSSILNNPEPGSYVPKEYLNVSQNSAVEATLSYPLTCLWGPPGTGKTHTIVEIIKQLQAAPGKRRILVTAPTHNAVDNVMRKYLGEANAGGRLNTSQSAVLRVSTDVSVNLSYNTLTSNIHRFEK
jgi:regulator of nonsense transcripts 1